MRSRTTPSFRRAYRKLPPEIQEEAKAAYKRWKKNPFEPALNFELISADPPPPLWSVRATHRHRGLGAEWSWRDVSRDRVKAARPGLR